MTALRRTLLTVIGVCCLVNAAAAQSSSSAGPAPAGTPILWTDPGAIAEKDLRWGMGSAERQPRPPFTFVKEDLSGSKPKVRVRDAAGVEWNVKFAGPDREKNEVHAEVAASRLLWAFGYVAEENYYVPSGRIEGVKDLERADEVISRDGSFRTARFERREAGAVRGEQVWSFAANPFLETKELSGLKILVALMNNWDNKPENTIIEQVTTSDGVQQARYLVSDWGASFGRMSGPPGWSPAPTRWRVDDYRQQPLTRGVADGTLKLNFIGQLPLDAVPIDHAAWFAELAAQLQLEQVRAAFAAAGASEAEATAFAQRFLEKVEELRAAVKSSAF
jgi:hypothetical protein